MNSRLLTVREAASQLHIGITKTFELIGRGELRSLKLDGKRLIPDNAVTELVERKLIESAKGRAA